MAHPAPGRLLSRNGTDLGDCFPEIRAASQQGWVWDGEVILADGRGVPTVYEVQRRWTRRRHRVGQARLAVFVVLASPHDGDVTGWPLRDRLKLLDEVPYSDTIVRMPDGPDGPELFAIAVRHGAEGIVAKQLHSRYRPGRSPAWLKFKRCDRITCLATGWAAGGDAPSGAVIARPAAGRLVPAGVVRYGFTAVERRRVRDLVHTARPVLLDVDCQDIAPKVGCGSPSTPGCGTTSNSPTCSRRRATSDPVAVSVESVPVHPNHPHRTGDVGAVQVVVHAGNAGAPL